MNINLFNCLGYRTLTVSGAAIGLSSGTDPNDGTAPAIPVGASHCTIQVQTNPVNFRDDGTAPTAAQGFPLSAGTIVESQRVSTNLKFIRTGSDATLHINYYGA